MWFNYRQNLSYILSESNKNNLEELFFTDNKIILSTILDYKIHTNLKKDFIIYKKYEHELKETFEDFFLFKALFLKRYFFSFYIMVDCSKQVIKSRDLFSTNMRFLNLYSYFYFFKRIFYYYIGYMKLNIFELDFFFYNLMVLKGISKKLPVFFGFTFKFFKKMLIKKKKLTNLLTKKMIKNIFLNKKKIRVSRYNFLPTIQMTEFKRKFYLMLTYRFKKFLKKYNESLFLVEKFEKSKNKKLFVLKKKILKYLKVLKILLFRFFLVNSEKDINKNRPFKLIILLVIKKFLKSKHLLTNTKLLRNQSYFNKIFLKIFKKYFSLFVLYKNRKKILVKFKNFFLKITTDFFNLYKKVITYYLVLKVNKRYFQFYLLKKLKINKNKSNFLKSKILFTKKKDKKKNLRILFRKTKRKLKSELVIKKDNFNIKLSFFRKIFYYSQIKKN